MFLKKLRVLVDGQEIRSIPFMRGLNLIVDETPSKRDGVELPEGKVSGNNVGKTTVLRCIDYCLGATPEPLYLDPEFKTVNRSIYQFLENNNPQFVLELEDAAGTQVTLSRRYADAGGMIDGEELGKKEYEAELRWILFRLRTTHPTLRELVPKFVRVEPTAKSSILHWLPYGKNDNYESIWLALFGFGDPKLLKLRRDIKKDIAKLNKQVKALGQVSKSPRQELPVIQRQLQQAKENLSALSLEGVHDGPLGRLGVLRQEINRHNQRLAELDASLTNVRHTLELFKDGVPRMNSLEVKELYQDVRMYVPAIHETYENLVKFHNKLLANKTKFVRRSETELSNETSATKKRLEMLIREESALLQSFTDPNVFADVRRLSDEIARLSQRLGQLEALEKAVEHVRSELASRQTDLIATETGIQQATDAVEQNLEIFNRYYAEYSQLLYGESWLVALQFTPDGKTNVSLTIVNLEGNEGSGKKKGQIAAFDLAYLRYRQEIGAKTARFTLQDEIELVDATQLRNLFRIAQTIEGQYILPVLQDRLLAVDFPNVDDSVVVRLSQTDRFFRRP